MGEQPVVGIFDADVPTALAFVRSLGRAGVKTRVYSHRRIPVARFSRYCREFASCPPVDQPDVFLPWLEQELRSGRIQLVAPTSDGIAFSAAEVAGSFAAELRGRLSSPKAIYDSLFKDRFDEVCRARGYPVPRSWSPSTIEEAHELAQQLDYPVVLKPKTHVTVVMDRGVVVHSAAELREHFKPYPTAAGSEGVRRKYPQLALPLIQEYVPRALENLYSVSGVISRGEILAIAASRKIAQWPPRLGIGIEFRAEDIAPLLDAAVPLVRDVLGDGIFELELIRDERDGQLLAIDLNPRAHGFISFDMARRNDLPLLWYRSAVGEPLSVKATRNDVMWTHSVPWHVSHWVRVLRGPGRAERLLQYVRETQASSVDIVNELSDPLPSLPFVAEMVKHPGGLVRPFFTEGK